MNVLYRGSNCSNSSESFDSLKKNIEYLKSITTSICIGMESTGIYHLPLYRYLRDSGFHVRILNGLEVRGMKKSRVRKTTNDSIDSESIARYLMVSKDKDSYDFPDELKNLKELVTALDILTTKITTTKNNITRIMDMEFTGLSNIINLDSKTMQKVISSIGKGVEGKPVRRISSSSVEVTAVKRHLDTETLNSIAEELKITGLSPEILMLVYSQLLDRPPINRMEEWLGNTDMLEILGVESTSTSRLYDSLDKLNEMDFDKMEENLSFIFSKIDGNRAVIIDVTDTYFEGKSIEGEYRRGKHEKVKKLVQIALAVTENRGFPLFHRTYGGNISGRRIFTEMIVMLRERGYSSIVMDRGFYSRKNIEDALVLKMNVICGVIKDRETRKRNFIWDVPQLVTRKEIHPG